MENLRTILVLVVSFFFIGCGSLECLQEGKTKCTGVEANGTTNSITEETSSEEETSEEGEETPVEEVSMELTEFSITSPTSSDASETVNPTITWSESDYTDSTTLLLTEDVTYDLTITSDSGCATAVQTYSDLTDLSKTLDTALAEGDFYVCINSKSQGEVKSATNNGFKIAVDLLPQDFTLATISDTSATGATHSVSISWGASTNATYYKISTDGTEASDQITSTSATLSVAASAQTGTSHSIIVNAYDAGSNKLASNTVTFSAVRMYALSELGSTYTVDDASALAKTSTYTSDLLLGKAYSCTKNSSSYVVYEYTDGFFITANATSSGNMQVVSAMSVITGWNYVCTAD